MIKKVFSFSDPLRSQKSVCGVSQGLQQHASSARRSPSGQRGEVRVYAVLCAEQSDREREEQPDYGHGVLPDRTQREERVGRRQGPVDSAQVRLCYERLWLGSDRRVGQKGHGARQNEPMGIA